MKAKKIFEKFVEDSDPISDMGIGDPEKSLLPRLKEELKKINIRIGPNHIGPNQTGSKGEWVFDIIFPSDKNLKGDYVVDEYIIKYTAKNSNRYGGFQIFKGDIYTDYDFKTVYKPKQGSHDIMQVVKYIAQLYYGQKGKVKDQLKYLQNVINIL